MNRAKKSSYRPTFKRPFSQRRSSSRPNPRFERRDDFSYKYKKNYDIRAQEVRLIDGDGTPRGVVDIQSALTIARDQDLDLVEVAPNAAPPVCRVISWSKFVYEQKKKDKDARKHKQKELKEFRFGTFIADGDCGRQLDRAREFLDKGHNVKLTVTRKGRTSIDLSKALLQRLLTQLEGYSTIEPNPSIEGRQMSITVKGALTPASHQKKEDNHAKTQNTQDSSKEIPTN